MVWWYVALGDVANVAEYLFVVLPALQSLPEHFVDLAECYYCQSDTRDARYFSCHCRCGACAAVCT